MAIRAISLLQRISLDIATGVHLMCAYACVHVHTKHLRSLFSWLTVRILYQLSFSLGLWEGKVVCIRPSLAIGTHRGALAHIRWGIRLECAGGGGETKL